MYRLQIDIPLGTDEELAVEIANIVMTDCFHDGNGWYVPRVNQFNYRLGHDEDRQKSNYLNKNENGHVNNKKIRISIGSWTIGPDADGISSTAYNGVFVGSSPTWPIERN